MNDKEYLEWWKAVYVATMRAGSYPKAARDCAEDAVRHLRDFNLNVLEENNDE